jgi:hypothetical protein
MKLPNLNPLFGSPGSAERAKQQNKILRYYQSMAKPKLVYTRTEPEGWPLTRPCSKQEWSHILRVMIVRRVPESGPIHRGKLIGYVHGDLSAASDAGRIYVDQFFQMMRSVNAELDRLITKNHILKTAPRMTDPEMPFPDEAIYRDSHASTWLKRVPRTVQAVVDFLPTTSVLDLLVQSLLDAHEPDHPPQPPQS